MREQLRDLIDYGCWATGRIAEAVMGDGGDGAAATRLLSHLIAAEAVWLARLRGDAPSGLAIWPERRLAELPAAGRVNRDGYRAWLAEQDAEALERTIAYRTSTGLAFETRAREILSHVAIHGSYHRGQVSQLRADAGRPPVATDYILYLRERGAPPGG